MSAWFVSTTRPRGQEVEWSLTPCASEDEAKALALTAIARGLRVEAGTAPGVLPRSRIGWRAAHHWARSEKPGSIVDLKRRLAEFAA
ncbi:MAG TPA: hypothetical protein VMI72_09540 [Roseiarcus sp.]|nr:hypothetical protein [Roseiarcus sp.]